MGNQKKKIKRMNITYNILTPKNPDHKKQYRLNKMKKLDPILHQFLKRHKLKENEESENDSSNCSSMKIKSKAFSERGHNPNLLQEIFSGKIKRGNIYNFNSMIFKNNSPYRKVFFSNSPLKKKIENDLKSLRNSNSERKSLYHKDTKKGVSNFPNENLNENKNDISKRLNNSKKKLFYLMRS